MTGAGSGAVDRAWALATAVAGLAGNASYLLLVMVPASAPVQVVLLTGFAFGLAVASLGLHHVVGMRVAPRLSLAATAANLMAVPMLMAMVLVQKAVKTAVPRPDAAFTAIWLGLDVAWDLFVGIGTLLYALCMVFDRRFRYGLGLPGLAVAALFLILNVTTFPTPPAEAGLFDAGPLVGLWYLAVSVSVGFLLRRRAHGAA